MADKKSDETDLVDASQLPSEEEDVTEARRGVGEEVVEVREEEIEESDVSTEHAVDDPFAMQMEAAKPGQATIASLRERLAAFLVDCGVLWLLYWGTLYVFHKLTIRTWIGPVPTMGYNAMLFHGIFLLLAFLYFFLLEAAFFATIGKFCCWMYVRRKDGHHAGALGVFIRNFFRLIELLTAGLLTWIPMELSHRHQRLGDMAAGTIVIKKHSASTRYYALDADKLASALGRSLALVIDLALVLVWLTGYVMLINYQAIYLSQWLVILFPVAAILFGSLVQVVMEGSPGLWLFGYTVTHEDGGRLTFAGALLRTLLAPLDLLLGLPCMLLSLRKQKIGDTIAATVVSRQRRRWKGAIASLVVVAFSVGLVALGLFINPVNNIFKAGADFKLSFMPLVEGLPEWESAANVQPPVLTVRNFRFGVNDPNTRRTPPVYESGETVYLLFEISGYSRKDRLVWIQEDLMVQYPDGTMGLKQENVVDYHQLIKPGGAPIELTNNIALPPTAAPGVYVITVTLRDMLANNYTVTETQSFTVKAPPSMTSPLEAIPPPPPQPSPLPVEPYGAQVPVPSAPPPVMPVVPAPTVPSSPLPVLPAAPAASPTPGVLAPAPASSVPGTVGAPTPPPAPAPSGGFTVIPGPSIAPKEEAVPPPTIPVVKTVTPPADQYGVVPATVPTPPVTPAPTVSPVVSAPTTPAIVEKTLTPSTPPVDVYAVKPPADAYAKPAVVTPAPVLVTPTPTAPTTPAPAKSAPKAVPAKPAEKPVVPKAAAPAAEKPKVTEKPATPKAATPATETQKAAEKELQKIAPSPAKPAAEIPSAEAVKKQAEQPAAPVKKKKKASSGGGSSGGYMP
jgi:uncharacterized RDD family membrane protein YckC